MRLEKVQDYVKLIRHAMALCENATATQNDKFAAIKECSRNYARLSDREQGEVSHILAVLEAE